MEHSNTFQSKTAFPHGAIALGVALSTSIAMAQTPPQDRAARQVYMEDVPFVFGAPVSCPGHPIDGLLVDATITVFGVEQKWRRQYGAVER